MYSLLLAADSWSPWIWVAIVLGGVLVVLLLWASTAEYNYRRRRRRYNRKAVSLGVPANEFTYTMLNSEGLTDVEVVKSGFFGYIGYRYRKKMIRLSRRYYDSASISSYTLASDSVSMAKMHADDKAGYERYARRNFFLGAGGYAFVPLALVGFLLDMLIAHSVGVWTIVFSLVGFVLYIVSVFMIFSTLKVEKAAAKTAIERLRDMSVLTEPELELADKLLRAKIRVIIAECVLTIFYIIKAILQAIWVILKTAAKFKK